MIAPLLLHMALWSTSSAGSLPPNAVFTTLRHTGPPSTVVDLVLLAEAYVAPRQFQQDAARLTHQIFDVGGAYLGFCSERAIVVNLAPLLRRWNEAGTPVELLLTLAHEAVDLLSRGGAHDRSRPGARRIRWRWAEGLTVARSAALLGRCAVAGFCSITQRTIRGE